MESIDRLREDLWIRWRRQMERSPHALESPAGSARVLYSRGPLFDLKTYSPRSFKAGGRSGAQAFPGQDNWVYHMDAAGRPVRMEMRHSVTGIDWRGAYRYAADEAEYVEWCVQTGVCSEYTRVAIREEQTVSFQRLLINARGSFPVWRGLSRASLIDRIASDPKNFRIHIERYDVADGRIQRGDAYTEGMGAPPMHAILVYTYVDGKLARIVQHSDTGEQTVFAARRPTSLRRLSADLSRRIAELTVDLLRSRDDQRPLAALELSYRSVETYVPLIIPCTEEDAVDDLRLCIAIDAERWLELPEESLAPDIADFHERLRSTGQYGAGTRMLREAARQVTALAPQQLRATPFFVAYAVDWEAEGDQLEEILRDCGATPESLREFRSRGWV